MSPRAAKSKPGLAELLRAGRLDEFVKRALELEPADLADVLSSLDEDERLDRRPRPAARAVRRGAVEMPEEEHAEDTLAALEPEQAADIVDELADDDAADILQELEPEEQERILSEVEDRSDVDRLLAYDEESAGGLMTTHVVTVFDTVTAGEAIEEIRRQAEEMEGFYQVFVVDPANRLRGAAAAQAAGDQPARPERCANSWRRRRSRVTPGPGPGGSGPPDGALQRAERAGGGRERRAAGPRHLRRRDRRGRGRDDRGPPAVRRRLGRRGARRAVDRRGAEPAPLALRQPAHRLRGGLGGAGLLRTRSRSSSGSRCSCRSSPGWAATPAPRRWRCRSAASRSGRCRPGSEAGIVGKEMLVGLVNGFVDRARGRRSIGWLVGGPPVRRGRGAWP